MPVGQFPKTPLRELFTAASADCLNLLNKCLIYDPKRRISAKDVSIALRVPFSPSSGSCTQPSPFRLCSLLSAGPQPPVLLRAPVPLAPIQAPQTREEGEWAPARGGRRQRGDGRLRARRPGEPTQPEQAEAETLVRGPGQQARRAPPRLLQVNQGMPVSRFHPSINLAYTLFHVPVSVLLGSMRHRTLSTLPRRLFRTRNTRAHAGTQHTAHSTLNTKDNGKLPRTPADASSVLREGEGTRTVARDTLVLVQQ